uniref:Uncharacterized protein n=1 Tax=Panagrolaimus davidi TaxID=227884 RepID=A0A914QTH1_9BILA
MNGETRGIMIIQADPISLDYKIFPNLGKEAPQIRKLQNAGYIFDNAKNFVGGYVFASTKTVWAQFQFNNASNKILNIKLNYNIQTSTVTIIYANVKSIKKLSNQYLADEQFYIIFDVSLPGDDYKISVNDEIVLQLSKLQLGDVSRALYGGKWKYVDLSANYQISFPQSLAKNQSCSIQPNSKMSIIPLKSFTNADLEIPMISEGQNKSIELRSSLCPGSDMIKFNVALVKHFNGTFFYHSSVYFRKKSQWQHMFTKIFVKTSTCTFISITEFNGATSFSCGNDIINVISSGYKVSMFLRGYVANMFTVNNEYLYKEIKYLVY